MGKPFILVVEDDPPIRRLLELEFVHAGFRVSCAATGEEGISLFRKEEPDLVVLDLMLPDISGWQVAGEIRRVSDRAVILMLTARGEVADRVRGLKSGADDYLVKPFATEELLARVEALLRRSRVAEEEVLRWRELEVRPVSRRVFWKGKEVPLSRTEFDLLVFLARRRGRVFNRDQILEGVWGSNFFGTPAVVDVNVSSLRRKLGTGGRAIRTVHGVGYAFEEEP